MKTPRKVRTRIAKKAYQDVPQRELRLIYQGGCYYCGGEIRWAMPGEKITAENSRVIATEEHMQPRCLGGGGGSNIVIACSWCNTGWANLIDQWALKTFGETHEVAVEWRASHGL